MDSIVSSRYDFATSISHLPERASRAPGLSARLALTKGVRKQAYELRHAGYLTAGYIDDRAYGGILRDEYDESAAARTIVLYKDDVPAASVRICLLDPTSQPLDTATLPACELFHPEINFLVAEASSLGRPACAVEVTRLARHPSFAKDNDLVFGLFRMTGYLILHHAADLVFISVCANHVQFYKRLGYEVIATPRDHPRFNAATGLMVCRKNRFQDICSGFPMMAGLSRLDGIYERFMQGELVPVIFPKKVGPGSPDPGFSTPSVTNSLNLNDSEATIGARCGG